MADGRVAHLRALHQRADHLRLQRALAPVVEQRLQVGGVDDRRRVPPEAPALDAQRRRQLVIGEPLLGNMTGAACHGAVRGQAAVEEELAPERDHRGRRQPVAREGGQARRRARHAAQLGRRLLPQHGAEQGRQA